MEAGSENHQELLARLLGAVIGSRSELVNHVVLNQRHQYIVAQAQLRHPSIDVVVKLAGPEAPVACPFERIAAVHHLVAARTNIKMPEVIAADVSYARWPWRYLILAHVAGDEWAHVRLQVGAEELSNAQEQIGEAVAQLHTIHFEAFGALNADGKVHRGQRFLEALGERARHTIRDPQLRDYFLSALDQNAWLFERVAIPSLCHDDLHAHNILFESRRGRWQLAAILDFDKAWAGHRETDLARLDLWTESGAAGAASESFWRAYGAVEPVAPLYRKRRPIHQLLWCLEYARPTARHLEDIRRICEELGLDSAPVLDRIIDLAG